MDEWESAGKRIGILNGTYLHTKNGKYEEKSQNNKHRVSDRLQRGNERDHDELESGRVIDRPERSQRPQQAHNLQQTQNLGVLARVHERDADVDQRDDDQKEVDPIPVVVEVGAGAHAQSLRHHLQRE